jgi:DNA modification methylase
MNVRSSIRELEQIDWNFADYISSQFPADINSLHWYPAAFVPQIPSILIKCLSEETNLILDPFSGSGITIIEASRLGRRFIGVDQNPYAINICKAKLSAISEINEAWFKEEGSIVQSLDSISNLRDYCANTWVDDEVFKWFDRKTLAEIFALHRHIVLNRGTHANILRQVIFSSILNRCCSQRDHYTYITDRCFPKEMVYRPAREMYCEQIMLACRAVNESRRHFFRIHGRDWKPAEDGIIEPGDARQLKWINDFSVDLVVTSPPYLGVNDYVRSMRLTSLLFPEEGGQEAVGTEIGARRKRNRKTAYDEYMQDMKQVFSEIARVLKRNGYLALVLGQGRGRVNKDNVLSMLIDLLKEHEFDVHFKKERRIKFRRIQVPGVETEQILVLRRKGT